MGFHASATHVRGCTQAAVVEALRTISRGQALVTRARASWVTVYDADSERSFREGCRVAAGLSKILDHIVVHMTVFDGDFVEYGLFDRGRILDTFNSSPSYFAPANTAYVRRTAGRADILARCCSSSVRPARVARLLVREDSPWQAEEEERLRLLARALGVQAQRALTRFSEVLRLQTPKCTAVYGARRPARMRVSVSNALMDAVARQNVDLVRDLLCHKLEVNATWPHGRTPLVAAVYHPKAKVELVKALLDAGARVDERLDLELIGVGRVHTNRTALHYAATVAPLPVVDILLEGGAAVDAADAEGTTPLMLSASVGRSDVVKRLLRAGADPRRTDQHGRSSMEWAQLALSSPSPEEREGGQASLRILRKVAE
jgi:hypothetical protein